MTRCVLRLPPAALVAYLGSSSSAGTTEGSSSTPTPTPTATHLSRHGVWSQATAMSAVWAAVEARIPSALEPGCAMEGAGGAQQTAGSGALEGTVPSPPSAVPASSDAIERLFARRATLLPMTASSAPLPVWRLDDVVGLLAELEMLEPADASVAASASVPMQLTRSDVETLMQCQAGGYVTVSGFEALLDDIAVVVFMDEKQAVPLFRQRLGEWLATAAAPTSRASTHTPLHEAWVGLPAQYEDALLHMFHRYAPEGLQLGMEQATLLVLLHDFRVVPALVSRVEAAMVVKQSPGTHVHFLQFVAVLQRYVSALLCERCWNPLLTSPLSPKQVS